MDKVVTVEKVLVCGDFNFHVGSDMGTFGEVHRSFGIRQINDGGIRFLDWAVDKGLRSMNTCFQKTKSRLTTFRSGENETIIDYILVNNRSTVKHVKVIRGEEIMSQHCLMLMDMVFKKKIRKKVKFRKKLKLWWLTESDVKEEFVDGVNNNCDGNEDWCGLKRKLLDVASEVCGYSKGKQGILIRSSRIKMWLRLRVERESYLGFGNKVGMKKLGRDLAGQKDMLRK